MNGSDRDCDGTGRRRRRGTVASRKLVSDLRSFALDDLDLRILDMLTQDSRASCAAIGRKLHLSRSAVRRRIQKLVANGVIENFTITINPYRMGREISAFFEIEVEPRRLQEVARRLAENPDILSVNQMTGPSTLHAHAALRDRTHLERFLAEHLYSLPGVVSVRSFILIRAFKTKRGGILIR